jgi:hypothetical protein
MGLAMKDLVALVADKHQEEALKGILTRTKSLDIRTVSAEVYVDKGRDPGCRTRGPEFLRSFVRQFQYALLVFDHQGSGAESTPAAELEAVLEKRLEAAGWSGRSAVVVIEPETEAWVWSPSRKVDAVLGWFGRIPALRDWLVDEGLSARPDAKPNDPKEALERSLRHVGKRPSGAIFRELAQRVSIQHCPDRAFQKLWTCLKNWFPP